MLQGSASEVTALIADYAPGFIVNAHSIELAGSPTGLDKAHVKMVKTLCRAAKDSNSVFVHISSALVFNGARGKMFVESDRPKPRGSISRRLTELEQTVIKQLEQHIVLRSGWLFGAHGQGAFQSLLSGMERGAEIRFEPTVDGAPTPAADVARVLFAMMQQVDCGAPCWGIYHYGSSDTTTGRDFSETVITMAAQYGKIDIERIRLVETGPGEESRVPRHPILDCNKILNTFGIKQRPWRSAMTGILKTIYQEQQPVEQVVTL